MVWFPCTSSCGLRLDEHPFNAPIVPNDNVCLLLTTRLQRPVNMSLLWGKTWMFCPCHVNTNCHFIHYAVIFTKPHLKFQMFENLSGSRIWLLMFLSMKLEIWLLEYVKQLSQMINWEWMQALEWESDIMCANGTPVCSDVSSNNDVIVFHSKRWGKLFVEFIP